MWHEEYVKLMFPINVNDMKMEEAMKLKYDNIPSSLYKYRVINEYSIQNLENDEVWVTTADKFNDPYDCALTLDCQYIKEILKKNLISIVPTIMKQKGIDLKVADAELENFRNQPLQAFLKYILEKDQTFAKEPDKIQEIISFIENFFEEKLKQQIQKHVNTSQKGIFICCFSELNDSILMWSHYAANHTGICVEYDFKQSGPGDILTRVLQPLIYKDEIFDLSKYLLQDKEKFNNLVTSYLAITKSLEWSYEKEWRLSFSIGGGIDPFNRKVPKPKAIYLGSKISAENKELIINLAARKGFPVYQMKLANNAFRLVAEGL